MKFIVSESKPVLRARPPRKAACLLTALVLAFCNADSRATSSNTVNVPISGNAITYAILANPYNHGGNTVAEIFSASKIPSGTAVYKYIALGRKDFRNGIASV